jgi:hypothetical protein
VDRLTDQQRSATWPQQRRRHGHRLCLVG